MEGVAGCLFSRRFKMGKISGTGIFLITAIVEMGQMAIILLISRPFQAAVQLVRVIAFPMIIMNALGMIIFLGTFNMVFMEEDSRFAEKCVWHWELWRKACPICAKAYTARQMWRLLRKSFTVPLPVPPY
uniref:LytS/YhcK type 5TM receptor domain-containing protein n=1 Tax=Clostridium sp. NkU-1 TaxID=1095009 RepID=UPI000AE6F5C3